ncbi:MAG: hypothetical protein GWP58_05170 [Gammaproteobacteria bacterium]|jgi:hypothetical protein|nr:hypothetical protein [Gammaproteobacteria bacterium]
MTTYATAISRFSSSDSDSLERLLSRYGMTIRLMPSGAPIPGSFWGDEEAGLIANKLILRPDTPLHSALHETCHYICMDENRRQGLNTDAGGNYDEESAVCYLQILLADEVAGFGRRKMMDDMDDWGYTFRLGSAQAWFEQDAEDAFDWLLRNGLITRQGRPTFQLNSKSK